MKVRNQALQEAHRSNGTIGGGAMIEFNCRVEAKPRQLNESSGLLANTEIKNRIRKALHSAALVVLCYAVFAGAGML